MSRILAIGDVHGCYRSLMSVLEAAQPGSDDALVFLGDYVDRGTESRQVIQWLINERGRYRMTCLRGNHEVMMIESREDRWMFERWREFGGFETMLSYGVHNCDDWHARMPEEHWTFLLGTPIYHETDSHIFVHGSPEPLVDIAKQSERVLVWKRCDTMEPHKSGKIIICGHTPQRSGLPWNLGYGVCIDTAAVYGGWLTCLEAGTGHFWQANQEGEIREGDLEDPFP